LRNSEPEGFWGSTIESLDLFHFLVLSQKARKRANSAISFMQKNLKKLRGLAFNPQPIVFPVRSRSFFRTWHPRPVFARQVRTPHSNNSWGDVALVLQGKIMEKANFTLETIEIYRKLFPQVRVLCKRGIQRIQISSPDH
jgi:hypothetical protein